MIRTPMQMHINVDDTLNDVHLYLPQFNEKTVYEVIEALRSSEGANIPTDIEAEELGADSYDTLTLRPTYTIKPRQPKNTFPDQFTLFDMPFANTDVSWHASTTPITTEDNPLNVTQPVQKAPAPQVNIPGLTNYPDEQKPSSGSQVQTNPVVTSVDTASTDIIQRSSIDREGIVKAINNAGLLTYNVRKVRISDYLKSMFALAGFLTRTQLDMDCLENVKKDITKLIHDHAEYLKKVGKYDYLTDQVLQFKMNTQIFDVFGRSIDNFEIHDFYSSTDTDIDRQFRLAEARLGQEGVGNEYCKEYYDINDMLTNKIEVILFAADADCMESLHDFANQKFHELNDAFRRKTVTLPERFKKKYDDIVSDGDIVSKHNFRLPETIRIPRETEGKIYSNHLFVDDSGTAMINLNGWEKKVIEEEEAQDGFVCWLRNPSRGSWSLCIPYEIDGEKKPMYPDFLIIRDEGGEYVVDILEPHDPSRIDNLGKAKGFAEYARDNPGVGRIQLIKMKKDSLNRERPFRLDMSKSMIRDRVLRCINIDELNHVFDDHGFFI
jgi:type III restriction enzyme